MKKFMAFSLVLALCTGLFCGCGSQKTVDESTVYVQKNGKITAVDVEAFDENSYSFDELQQYVEDTVAEYNAGHDKHSVKMKSLKMQDGKAVLSMEYQTAEDYENFSGTKIFVGSVAEALAAGYSFSQDFVKVDGGQYSPADSSEIVGQDGYKIVIIRANTNVEVKGTIHYTSVRNVDSVGKNTVAIRPGVNLLDLVSRETQEEPGTEAPGTEETVDEGSIDEDDLLEAQENEMIEFDFGSEDSVEETDYTNVYTYIIYK
ncbi:MAG: hypothetical protein PUF45_07045 [Lachnospiraceae bacterium]|nr:hypothetical protein [Lachnospiraceae bacterium]